MTRQADVDRALADPPQVHASAASGAAPLGVWSTDASCYQFLADTVESTWTTLETGLGVSTVLFAQWVEHHTCIVPFQAEIDIVTAYCHDRSISTGHVPFVAERSDLALPRMVKDGPLDLVLIDGLHGFPTPLIDWYYAANRLRRGGVLILDDVNLPSVSLGLVRFLDRDSRWERIGGGGMGKWLAYRRSVDADLSEDWTFQRFLDDPPPMVFRLKVALKRALTRTHR